jgi:hypothetical protein
MAESAYSEAFQFANERIRARLVLNTRELARRAHSGAEPPSASLLEALFVLPEASAVPIDSLPGWAVEELAEAPGWALGWAGATVTRCYQPPATVQELVVADPGLTFENQLTILAWVRAVAPCSLLSPPGRPVESVLGIASAAGLGVAIGDASGSWGSAQRAPSRRVRSTSQRWRLAEFAASAVNRSAAAHLPKL